MPKGSRIPRPPSTLRRAVAAAITRGRYRRALDMLSTARRERRRDPRLCLLHGRALARLHLTRDALNAARRALELDPELTDARLLIADLHLAQGRLTAATRAYQDIRRISEQSNASQRRQRARACGGLALCAAEKRCFTEADVWLEQAFDLAPDDPTLWCDRGDVARLSDRFRAAANAYRKALTCKGQGRRGDPWALLGLARLDYEAGRFKRAAQHVDEAIAAAPEEAAGLLLGADIALVRHHYEHAAEYFRRAYELSPRGDYGAEALYSVGEAAYRAGDADGAVAAFRHFLKQFPTGGDAVAARRTISLLTTRNGRVRPDALARVELADFPRLRQRWDYCGPAALAMVLRYWKKPGNQDRIGKIIWEGGTPLYRMRSYLQQSGLKTACFRGTPASLKALIDRGVPVILEVQTSPYGHFRIAIGYDDLRRTVLLQDPGFPEPVELTWTQLERDWSPEGNWSLAAVPADRAKRLDDLDLPQRHETEIVDRARALMDRNRPREAARLLERHVPVGCGFAPADRLRIQIAIETNNLARARDLARKATRRHDGAAWPWQLLADAHRLRHEYGAAARDLNTALRREPGDFWSILGLGRLALERGQVEEARRHFRRAVRLDPDAAMPHEGLGACYVHERKFTRALRSLRRARELDPENPVTWQEEGYVLDSMGRLDEAEGALRRALDLAPRDPWVQNEMAYVLARANKRLKHALQLARRARRGGYSPRCDVEDTIGYILHRLGRHREAVKHLRTAERSARARRGHHPQEKLPLAEIRLHLAEALSALGDEKAAVKSLHHVADSDTELAAEARKMLRRKSKHSQRAQKT